MIRATQMLSLLLEACPSYSARWAAYRSEPEFDAELLYTHLGDFAQHVVDLLERLETAEFAALGAVIERLHLQGDGTVREAATVGLLEGIQNAAGNRKVSTGRLETALGAETLRWWRSLNAFWSGQTPYVGADMGTKDSS